MVCGEITLRDQRIYQNKDKSVFWIPQCSKLISRSRPLASPLILSICVYKTAKNLNILYFFFIILGVPHENSITLYKVEKDAKIVEGTLVFVCVFFTESVAFVPSR